MEKTKELLSYCAGLFDGEGTAAISKEKHHQSYDLDVVLFNSDKGVIDLFHALWGGSITRQVKGSRTGVKYTARRDVWQLRFSADKKCYQLLTDLLPYIRIKQKQFQLAKEYIEKIRSLRSLRPKGSRYTGIELAYRKEAYIRMKHLNAPPGEAEEAEEVKTMALPQMPKLF